MSATPDSKQKVIQRLHESHREWPYSADRDTVNGDPWPIAWDAAAFIEEWFTHSNHNDVEEAVCNVPISPDNIGYDVTEWHYKQPPEPLLRAHLLRIVKGWGGEKALHDYLTENPELVDDIGFDDEPASKTTLWRVWNRCRISETHKRVIRIIGQVIVNIARQHGVPAPDEVFHPDPGVDAPNSVEQNNQSVRDRTVDKAKEMWAQAKPLIEDNYSLSRGDNAEIHEDAFFEAHAFIGSRQDMYAESGADSFYAQSSRDRVQTGSTHRYHLQKIQADKARQMHHGVTKDLIEQARGGGELTDEVIASIDITKSNPYRTGKRITTDENGTVTNDWLLGYKEEEDESADFYFQWASIQISGRDIPLVLDVIPVRRNMTRAQIVNNLLSQAQKLIDIDLLLMDAEFSGNAVKRVCELHDVLYLVSGRMTSSKRATCTKLRKNNQLVAVEDDEPTDRDPDADMPKRKQLFVPAMNADRTGDELSDDEAADQDDNENNEQTEAERRHEIRENVVEEISDATDQDDEAIRGMFSEFLDEYRQQEEQRETRGNNTDAKLYKVFETNHPAITHPDDADDDLGEMSETNKAHMIASIVRKYSHRWTIENGYKKVKKFRVRTTSMDHEYRYFNFLYACTLYNVWRLVDLLVKLELMAKTEFHYKPIITADVFLSVADEWMDLDPPRG